MTNRLASDRDTNPALRVPGDRAEGAFLGAAIGDALGWPHEMRAFRTEKNRTPPTLSFVTWTKRSGGRFQPHEELIEAGHYSDDTQLILAAARALLREPNSWWVSFTSEELPLWTLYQRGGGGATKRAASSWLAGRAPWNAKPEDAARYFSAGGNGVAMRILPHCLRHAGAADFSKLAADIMTDGVTTHGHPRALIGALAYGYGLWQAFRHRGTLAYGQLLDAVRANSEAWGAMPAIGDRWSEWAEGGRRDAYAQLWSGTVHEQLDLLDRCAVALAGGVAVIDDDLLRELGCFDPRMNGSGTVNAAAALFLASRNAADPIEGVKQAALAEGADTDTLASMTGGLLGAALGLGWMSTFARDLQDEKTIRQTGGAVRDLSPERRPGSGTQRVTKASLATFIAELQDLREPSQVQLPNGLTAGVEIWNGIKSKARSLTAQAWRLTLEDGQTLFVKKLSKASFETPQAGSRNPELDRLRRKKPSAPLHVGFRLVVSNLSRSVAFYQEVIGLPISKRTVKSVNLGGILSLAETTQFHVVSDHITVFVAVADLERSISAYQRLMPEGLYRVEEREDRTRMQCLDPDGYRLEVYESKTQSAPAE